MVQTDCNLELKCKCYTRASSIFLDFWEYFNFLFSDLWGKYFIRQVSYGASDL
jgi:hypothetical protein